MKYRYAILLTLLMSLGALTTQSCKWFGSSGFTKIEAADLTTLAESLPDRQKRQLAENQAQRKDLIKQLKQAFALAQAAEDEGLDDTEKFKNQLSLNEEQLLASEYSKRNQNINIPKEELDAFFAANKDAFEKDLAVINQAGAEKPTEEQREMLKSQWSELRVRAKRAREAGIDKEPLFQIQRKFNRANLLANLYAQTLQDRFKLTDEEKKKYVAEHPEADAEKIKVRAQGLLDRLKKGESFEKIADEVNEDGTRGRGGDLDWFGKGRMDPDFEKAAFALEKGATSQELVKTSFGFHIVRVDDRRKAAPSASPTPAAPDSAAPAAGEPQEEIRARHIFLSLQEAESYEQRLLQEKVKRAMEDATLKYEVAAPEDFAINVSGVDLNRRPGLGGGQGGTMRRFDPNENK
ncbi:MAG: peptidylprolyl isomerase [Blastocatellales bacterium]